MNKGTYVRRIIVGAVSAALLLGAPAVSAASEPVPGARATGAVAEAIEATSVPAAKKSKAKPAKFAAKVHKVALRKVKAKANVRDAPLRRSGIPFKSTKKRTWWVSSSGHGHYIAPLESVESLPTWIQETYRKAVVKELKRRGLKPVGTLTGWTTVRSLAGNRYVCSVEEASFSCLTRTKAVRDTKKMKPYRDAYAKKWPSKGMVFHSPAQVNRSSAKSYRAYKKAGVILGWGGGAQGYFAKAPGKKWMFVVSYQDIPECEYFEKSRVASRAWAGTACYGPDGEDVVRPR